MSVDGRTDEQLQMEIDALHRKLLSIEDERDLLKRQLAIATEMLNHISRYPDRPVPQVGAKEALARIREAK